MKSKSKLFTVYTSTMVLILGLASCGYKGNENFSDDRMAGIIGGTVVDASDPIAKRVVLLFDERKGSVCTASIIHKNVLVTAAHCVESGPKYLVALFARSTSDPNGIEIRASAAVQHPNYMLARIIHGSFESDIAIVKLKSPIPAGYIPAQILADRSVLVKDGIVTLAGYGITNGTTKVGTGVLRKVDTKIAHPMFSISEVLIDQTGGKGACHGDSGGPAYVTIAGQLHLFGVTSRGIQDSGDTCLKYVAYTNILHYKNWIKELVAKYSVP